MARPRGTRCTAATKAKLSASMRRGRFVNHVPGELGWSGNAQRLIALLRALDEAYRSRCQPSEA